MNNNKPPMRIESICIVHQDGPDPVKEGMNEVGIFAEAEVSYPITVFRISDQGYHEHRRIETLRSEGIWGIACDSKLAQMSFWEREQLDDLKKHLSTFGVDVSNFHQVSVQMRRE